ncbi:tRNA dihydrouridine synthase [Collinsella sp.]|uniref:tRNA dihydrouridine synthase n=1 Tax=Collinsella sp. TaxID=1965294 RepID=UPI003FEF8F6F
MIDLREQFRRQPFLMAPMAGVTDAAYRIMCRRRGAEMAYTEMVSVAGLSYKSAKTWVLVEPEPEEPQICVQLFGTFAVDAVQERVGEKLSLIDINMACPARKVITKGEGSALMKEPELAASLVEACVREARVPVTVKIRRGFAAGENTAAEFAARMEQAGAAAVAVHGRTANQLYTGEADWSTIDEVAARVDVPVIGSGDVFSAEDAARMLNDTAADAVFIARGIYGNPWIFGDARAFALDGVPVPERIALERIDALREHLTLLHATQPYMARARAFAGWYLKGLPHAAAWRGKVVRCTSYEEFMSMLDEVEADVVAFEAAPADAACGADVVFGAGAAPAAPSVFGASAPAAPGACRSAVPAAGGVADAGPSSPERV